MTTTVNTKKVAALVAVVAAAVAMSLAVGTASAAPLKNAQRVCEKAGGTFDGTNPAQYGCTGNDPTGAFSFFKAAQGQCVHSFKGAFSPSGDPATGNWSYTCILQ